MAASVPCDFLFIEIYLGVLLEQIVFRRWDHIPIDIKQNKLSNTFQRSSQHSRK